MSTPNYTKACSSCRLTFDAAGFYTDRAKKDGLASSCRECVKARSQKHRQDNLEAVKAKQREYVARNTAEVTKKKQQWYENNKVRVLSARAEYRVENQEKVKSARIASYYAKADYYREQTAEWKAANPEAYKVWCRANAATLNARGAARRAAKLKATPLWADFAAIAAVYTEASRRRAAGEDVEVDHVVPLKGKHVRGLHVHYNLQIIPAIENQRKKNQFTDALPKP